MKKTRFRANELASTNRDWAIDKLTSELEDSQSRETAIAFIDKVIAKYGPVVHGYPCWHPFTEQSDPMEGTKCPKSDPQEIGPLDHRVYFRHAFITAPYGGAKEVVESVRNKRNKYIEAEILEVDLYHSTATPVLVKAEFLPTEPDGTICKRYALARMLLLEIPGWEYADFGESWESMHRHILGTPCGSRSSLFVNQTTGQALRDAFNMLNRLELFGPVKVRKALLSA